MCRVSTKRIIITTPEDIRIGTKDADIFHKTLITRRKVLDWLFNLPKEWVIKDYTYGNNYNLIPIGVCNGHWMVLETDINVK